MNIDCQWIEKNLEAIFRDGLTAEEDQAARAHIESCENCRREIQALIAVDPLIKQYFQKQLALAGTRPSAAPSVRFRRLAAGVATVVAVLVFALLLRTPRVDNRVPTGSVQPEAAATASTEALSVKKNDNVVDQRAKPSPSGRGGREAAGEGTRATLSITSPDAPAFLITDLAGYSRSLEDYRGFTLLMGVWSPNLPESVRNLERLYKTFGSNPKLRVAGVSDEHVSKPPNATFPIFYNQGSRLLDAKPGEFVLIDGDGAIRLRGSLLTDFDALAKSLR